MPTSVSLNPHFEQFIRTQIDSGHFNDESEVVRAALRLLEDQQSKRAIQLEGLRSAIDAGLRGPGIPAEEAFDRVEAKYQAISYMHEAVGRAVLWAQAFETVFAVSFQLLGILESGVSYPFDEKRYKTPTRNLIKELSAANNIAAEFESQLNDLIENRHLLIHRWFLENGLPNEKDHTEISKLIRLANEVEQESKRISGMLSGYVVRWGRLNPAQDLTDDSERTRLLGLFQRAHLGDTGE